MAPSSADVPFSLPRAEDDVARALERAMAALNAVTQLTLTKAAEPALYAAPPAADEVTTGAAPRAAVIMQVHETHAAVVTITLPVELARVLIAAVLGTSTAGPHTPPRLTDMECGALGYVAAQCIAHARARLELVAVLATEPALQSHLAHQPATCVRIDTAVSGTRYSLEVWLHERSPSHR